MDMKKEIERIEALAENKCDCVKLANFWKMYALEIQDEYKAEIESLRAKLAESELPTPSQSEPVGWWREGNDLDESDYYPAEHFPDLDTTGCIPLYTKPQPTSQEVVDSVQAAREACAKICLDLSAEFNDPYPLVRASNCILARNERE